MHKTRRKMNPYGGKKFTGYPGSDPDFGAPSRWVKLHSKTRQFFKRMNKKRARARAKEEIAFQTPECSVCGAYTEHICPETQMFICRYCDEI